MKKTVAGIALLLPLALSLCACGSANVEFEANWYKSGSSVSGKSETLEYEVSFTPDEANNILTYENGKYTTSLTVETLSNELVYHLRASFEIDGAFTVQEDKQAFHDSVVSDVYFKTLDSRLQPVKSEKTVHSTTPKKTNPKTMDEAFEVYDYVYAVNYTDGLKKASVTYAQTLPEARTEEKTFSVKSKNIFFDNEQLLFVLRGVDMRSAVSLKTINPLTLKQTGVKTSSPKALAYIKDFSFTMNGETVTATEEKPLNAVGVTLSYNGVNSGAPQKLVYAAKAKQGENTYRNVLLEMSVPVLYGLGTFDYQLKNAIFND